MPRISRGFYACDYCGLQHDTEEEAREHEQTSCSRRQRPPTAPPPGTVTPGSYHHPHPQQKPASAAGYPYYSDQQHPQPQHSQQQHQSSPYISMGPLSVTETEAYPSNAAAPSYFYQTSMGSSATSALSITGKDGAIPLLHSQVRNPNLTFEDNTACQSIEVFEATPEILAEYDTNRQSQDASSSPSSSIAPKQVGIRCIYCAKHPQSAPPTTLTAMFRMVFPPSLASMADHVRKVSDHHLASCRMAPPNVQDICQRASVKRKQLAEQQGATTSTITGDDNDRTRAALIDFCVGFCQNVGIANKHQHKSGMEFVGSGSGGPDNSSPANVERQQQTPYDYRGPPSAVYPERLMGGYSKAYGGMVRPGEPIAPTPLQRTRDRSMEQTTFPPSTAGNTPSTMGYPTPYSTQRSKGENRDYSALGETETPAQPIFERRESTSGMSASYHPSPQRGQHHVAEGSPEHELQQYGLPSNFPFYQDSDRTWSCKFCAHSPPHFRDPQSVWSSRDGGPPPGHFIDQHLSMCRSYLQGYASGMIHHPGFSMHPAMQTPFGPGGWEAPPHMMYPGAHPSHDYQFAFPSSQVPPPHLDPSSGRYIASGPSEQESSGMYGRGRSGSAAATPSMGSANVDATNHAMNYLAQFDKDYYEKDMETAAIPKLVLDEDRLLLTDYFFFLMKQLRLCRFSESDRKTRGGKREKIKIGYGGLQCIHCADLPMSRKFFWSNVDRLANSFAEIPGHVLKCKRCPTQCKDALMQLKQAHPEQMAKLPRGSQKVFFRRMWRRLHDDDPKQEDEQATSQGNGSQGSGDVTQSPRPTIATSPEKNSPESHKSDNTTPSSGQSYETALVVQRTAMEAAKALILSAQHPNPPAPLSPSSRILLAIPEDKEWLSEKDCFIRKQLEVFCATEDDVIAAQADRKYPVSVGQVGIRCIHCSLANGSDAVGHAVSYPFTISGIHESVREFHRLHLDSCENLPPSTKEKLDNLGASSLSSVLRRYYVLAAKALGLRDTRDSGIRSGGESSPIGSQAAFAFAEQDDEEEEVKAKEDSKPSAITSDSQKPISTSGNPKLGKRSSDTEDDEPEVDRPPSKLAKTG